MRDDRDLHAWQRAMDRFVVAHAICRKLPAEYRFTLGDQVRRSAISVPANIAEGNARSSRREYIRFLDIALALLRELETLLEGAARVGLIDTDEGAVTSLFAGETRMMLIRLRASLQE